MFDSQRIQATIKFNLRIIGSKPLTYSVIQILLAFTVLLVSPKMELSSNPHPLSSVCISLKKP